jgi:hypothetical protein
MLEEIEKNDPAFKELRIEFTKGMKERKVLNHE